MAILMIAMSNLTRSHNAFIVFATLSPSSLNSKPQSWCPDIDEENEVAPGAVLPAKSQVRSFSEWVLRIRLEPRESKPNLQPNWQRHFRLNVIIEMTNGDHIDEMLTEVNTFHFSLKSTQALEMGPKVSEPNQKST